MFRQLFEIYIPFTNYLNYKFKMYFELMKLTRSGIGSVERNGFELVFSDIQRVFLTPARITIHYTHS